MPAPRRLSREHWKLLIQHELFLTEKRYRQEVQDAHRIAQKLGNIDLAPGKSVRFPKKIQRKLTIAEKEGIRRDVRVLGFDRALRKRMFTLRRDVLKEFTEKANQAVEKLPYPNASKPELALLIVKASFNAGMKKKEMEQFLRSGEFSKVLIDSGIDAFLKEKGEMQASSYVEHFIEKRQSVFDNATIEWIKKFDAENPELER